MIGSSQHYALALRGLVKQFGGVRALDGANLEVRRATIHGLVGQNGAGKSTLIKILAGIFQPDSGTIEIDGQRCSHLTSHKAEKLGVHFIHQERLLVPTFTVGEALFLANEPIIRPLPLLDRRRMKDQARQILRSYFDIELPGEALISELTPAEQQIVQITRALLRNPSVLVFDEPTAALVKREADHLLETIQRLRERELTIVYISHYLNEIELLCDYVTVLRNGVDVGTVDPRTVPAASIASMMVARDIEEMFPKKQIPIGESILTVRDLTLRRVFAGISFELRRGEILGVTGLLGSGMKELVRCLFGLQNADRGEVLLNGLPVRVRTPFAAVARNLALVPEDRREHGVSLGMSVRENMTLASLQKYTRYGLLDPAGEKTTVDALIQHLRIQTPDRETSVRYLSGGNQQKVVLAKWLSCKATVYLLDEPTVGVDVGAKVEIYRLIGTLAEQGSGILLLSTDLLELSGICDRILVMYRGRITREFTAAEIDSDEILASATGAGLGSPQIADDRPVDIPLKEVNRSSSVPEETPGGHRGFVLLLQAGSLVVFTSVMIYFAFAAPAFVSFGNIANVLEQSAILGVLSFGMTIVFIAGGSDVVTGGIDLSLANNLGLSAAVYSTLVRSGYSDAVALPLTLLTGVAIGSLNAIAVIGLKILPLLATLTVMNICAGLELVLTQNTVVQATTPLLSTLADNGPFGVPYLAYILLVIAAILIFGVEYTPFGLRLYAVGAYRHAARTAGLRVNFYVVASYLLSGLCGGIAATLSVGLLSGSSTSSGEMLLSVVFAALLGVVFSRRLVPSVSGTLLSVLFIGFLINGFQLTNISSYWVNGVEGILILLVVAATSLSRRGQS